jgi:tRNA(Ile)-lysidine synthase TilS/MesJ
MYSGGLDSLGTVYKLLTDPQYKNYRLHLHHIHIKNVENRDRAENVAVRNTLKELERLGFSFMYSESGIDSPMYNNQFMFDIDSINFFAGYICSLNPDIELIALGMNADDSQDAVEEKRKRADAILAAFTSVKKIYPVLHMSKLEIFDTIPETLRTMFWSCRTPIYTEDMIKYCGQCQTCSELRNIGILK